MEEDEGTGGSGFDQGEVTALLKDWARGDEAAADRLFSLVYSELREIAKGYFRRESASQTLQPTALVHEAYFRLVDQTRVEWKNSGHFFAVASQAMRRILVDQARSRATAKRGSGREALPLEVEVIVETAVPAVDVLALDQALGRLAAVDSDLARLVDLRFFGGMTLEETAVLSGRSLATVKRDWRAARAFLHRQLGWTAPSP